jgi:hypothetical protein
MFRRMKVLFLGDPATRESWPESFRDDLGNRGEKLRRLRDELSTGKTVAFFHNSDEHAALGLAAILRSGEIHWAAGL